MDIWGRYDVDSLANRQPAAIERAVGWVEKTLVPYHRATVRGLDRIPGGPGLYVGNHNSFTYTPDMFIFGAALFRQRGMVDVPYGLAHSFILRMPWFNRLICPLGAIRACRENGLRVLQAGGKVLVYPGGDVDALRPFRHRGRVIFGGRQGYMRLALEAGVPIIPVVAAGAHATFIVIDDLRWLARLLGADRRLRIKVWPLTLSLPWGLTLGPPPPHLPFPSRIRVEVLEPISFARHGAEAAADPDWVTACCARVEGEMQAALTRLEASA